MLLLVLAKSGISSLSPVARRTVLVPRPSPLNREPARKHCTQNRCESERHVLHLFAISSFPPRARIVRRQGNRRQRSSLHVATISSARRRHHRRRLLAPFKVQVSARCKHLSDPYEKRRSSSWKQYARGGKRNAPRYTILHKAAAGARCRPQVSRVLAVANHFGTTHKRLQALRLQGEASPEQHIERCGSPSFRSLRSRRLLQSCARLKPTGTTRPHFCGFRQQADFNPKGPKFTAGHKTLRFLVPKESAVISREM